jgi:hypothetical protein
MGLLDPQVATAKQPDLCIRIQASKPNAQCSYPGGFAYHLDHCIQAVCTRLLLHSHSNCYHKLFSTLQTDKSQHVLHLLSCLLPA